MLKSLFSKVVLDLFHHVLTSTYFLHSEQYYKQTEGVVMGCPLSPIIANFYMETLQAYGVSPGPPEVDDTFVFVLMVLAPSMTFWNSLNGIHPIIQFSMEMEGMDRLSFMDPVVYRRVDSILGHKLFWN